MKNNPKPVNKLQDNIAYLRNTNVSEAKKVVESCKDMPHLQKRPKMLLK